jgi:hypothetical protein
VKPAVGRGRAAPGPLGPASRHELSGAYSGRMGCGSRAIRAVPNGRWQRGRRWSRAFDHRRRTSRAGASSRTALCGSCRRDAGVFTLPLLLRRGGCASPALQWLSLCVLLLRSAPEVGVGRAQARVSDAPPHSPTRPGHHNTPSWTSTSPRLRPDRHRDRSQWD